MNTSTSVKVLVVVVALALIVAAPDVLASAGGPSGGQEFDGFLSWLKGLVTGTVGKILAIATFLIGAFIGAKQNSGLPTLAGFVLAAILAYGVPMIEGIFTAAV